VRGLPAGLRVTAIAAGYDHCACVDGGGWVWTWGAPGTVSRHRFVAPEGYTGPDDAECAARATRRAVAAAAACDIQVGGETETDSTGSGPPAHAAVVALAGGRLEGVGQLGRTDNTAAAAQWQEPLPAARAERFGRARAVAVGGSFTLPWPAEGAPWVSAPPSRPRSGAAHDHHGSARRPCDDDDAADEIIERVRALDVRDHDDILAGAATACTPLLFAASPFDDTLLSVSLDLDY